MKNFNSHKQHLVSLNSEEVDQISGGIPYSTAARLAILDGASISPLLFAFSLGYSIGTLGYTSYRKMFGY